MSQSNPFTERGRIRDPEHFVGRWREVSLVFERLERRRPVVVCGVGGIGKSSLVTHIAQSAAAVLELPKLAPYYVDLAVLLDAEACYRLLAADMGVAGASPAALAQALRQIGRSVLVCLDHADQALAAGWGEELIERLARLARSSVPIDPEGRSPDSTTYDLMLLVAAGSTPPVLSEPLAAVVLGSLSTTEARLLCDAYLDETDVVFSSAELRELIRLSTGHPAYLQRAAFELFRSRHNPDHDWRAAYLADAREQPVPGAALPDEVFVGETVAGETVLLDDPDAPEPLATVPPRLHSGGTDVLAAALVPLIVALIGFQISGNWIVALLLLALGYLLTTVWLRKR
jgi:hypothetical protein